MAELAMLQSNCPINTHWQLPEGWEWKILENAGKVYAGSPAPQGNQFFEEGKYNFVRTQDLGREKRTTNLCSTLDWINQRAINEMSLVKASKGTILFPKSGAAIMTNNRAILGINAYIVSHLAAITVDRQSWDEKFVYYWLCQVNMADYLNNPTYPSLNLRTIKKISIPKPPDITTQHLIVARIEELMAEIKKARQLLDKMRRDTDRIIEIALEEKLATLEKTQIIWQPLGSLLLTKPQYGISKKAFKDISGIPIIGMKNIVNGRLSLDNFKYVSLTSNEVEKYLLHYGDILFNRTNSAELVGKSAVFESNERAVFASYLIRLVADPKKVKPYYLAKYINSRRGRMYVQSQLTRAIGQVNVNAKKLAAMPILTPDLKTQDKVIDHINNIQSDIEKMRGLQDQDSELLNQLEQSVLERAFRGEL